MSLKIFNALSGEKKNFSPLMESQVRNVSEIFGLPSAVCAQFHRVDNKIIKRANGENVSWDKITERYIDSAATGVTAEHPAADSGENSGRKEETS